MSPNDLLICLTRMEGTLPHPALFIYSAAGHLRII